MIVHTCAGPRKGSRQAVGLPLHASAKSARPEDSLSTPGLSRICVDLGGGAQQRDCVLRTYESPAPSRSLCVEC